MLVVHKMKKYPSDKVDIGAGLGGTGGASSEGGAEIGFMCPFLIFAAMPALGQ